MSDSPTFRVRLPATLSFRATLKPTLVRAGPIAVHPSESLDLAVERKRGSVVPHVDIGLEKNQWDLLTIGTGASVGGVIGHLPGCGYRWDRALCLGPVEVAAGPPIAMVPAFFVPKPDGTHRDREDARRAYESCRKEAEREAGRPAIDQPVFRLRFVHSDYRDELVAEVGELDPYGYKRLVVAIVPFEDHYWLCTSAPNHMVGDSAVRHIEHFAQPAP